MPKSGSRAKGIPADEAEILVREWLTANAKADPAGVTRDAIASGTGVSAVAVSNTASWKAFRRRRNADSATAAREVPLTDAMLVNIPAEKDTDELNALIEQQAEDDASDGRRTIKGGGRHERRHGPS